MEQDLCNGWVSVRLFVCLSIRHPSVCPIDRQQQRRPGGLLLSALCTCGQEISINSCGLTASAMLQAPALSSKCGQHFIESQQRRLSTLTCIWNVMQQHIVLLVILMCGNFRLLTEFPDAYVSSCLCCILRVVRWFVSTVWRTVQGWHC